jgi:thymidylate synthase ThyX
MYEARIERDSITQYGERLTTFVGTFPRIVLAEFNTHRIFSRSSASSRAIPPKKQIERLYNDLFEPVWGKEKKGMQASEEVLTLDEIARARDTWNEAMYSAIKSAEFLMDVGIHKQTTNRLLEPFMWHTVIVTATEWSNFFHLRDNKLAQPEIQKVAALMNDLYRTSRPKLLKEGDWHLPFEPDDDSHRTAYSIEERIKISVGRSARVSYLNHEGQIDPTADKRLANTCLTNGHMAPWEHVARPMSEYERASVFGRSRKFASPIPDESGSVFTSVMPWKQGEYEYFCGNFNGWVQARKLIHGEEDALAFERG